MNTRERILTIRLMEKMEKHPTYAKALGIEATGVIKNQKTDTSPKASQS